MKYEVNYFYVVTQIKGDNGKLAAFVERHNSTENLIHTFDVKDSKQSIGTTEIRVIGINYCKSKKQAEEICQRLNKEWRKENRYLYAGE